MTVAEFFKKARESGLRGVAWMEARRWPGNSGQGTFELSMNNGENDLMTVGMFGYHQVPLKFRLPHVDEQANAKCRGRGLVIE